MRSALLFFCAISCVMSNAQTLGIDTSYANKIINTIDSLERFDSSLKTVILRKYMHNETTVNHVFLLDPVTLEFFKIAYVSLTVYGSSDSISEKKTFYIRKNRFVAVRAQKYRNSRIFDSLVIYVDDQYSNVRNTYPINNRDGLSTNEINNMANDLRQSAESLKKWLRKKNDG